jgi:hypothetical protein
MSQKIVCGNVEADVHYDTTDPKRKGWYALYSTVPRGGNQRMITDSEKIGHPEMPTRKDAKTKASRIARAFACKLSRGRR